jgi:hypothetical protein
MQVSRLLSHAIAPAILCDLIHGIDVRGRVEFFPFEKPACKSPVTEIRLEADVLGALHRGISVAFAAALPGQFLNLSVVDYARFLVRFLIHFLRIRHCTLPSA